MGKKGTLILLVEFKGIGTLTQKGNQLAPLGNGVKETTQNQVKNLKGGRLPHLVFLRQNQLVPLPTLNCPVFIA